MVLFMTKHIRRDPLHRDTAWSDPGSTFGIPDRWQWRNLDGLHLTVGNNHRKPGGIEFVVPASRTPWKVYGYAPNDKAVGQLDLALIASGEAGSSEAARNVAESFARHWRGDARRCSVIRYRCHIVYVVTASYPTMGAPCDVVRAADRRDLATEKLGVISDGKCIPLSPYEAAEVRARCAS